MLIGRTYDVGKVLIPTTGIPSSPNAIADWILYSMPWSAGGFSLVSPDQMFQAASTLALPAGASTSNMVVVPSDQWLRIFGLGCKATTGAGGGTVIPIIRKSTGDTQWIPIGDGLVIGTQSKRFAANLPIVLMQGTILAFDITGATLNDVYTMYLYGLSVPIGTPFLV